MYQVEVANCIKRANSITVLTGAGVSTASGIPDFRSTTGVWSQDKSREYYMSRDYFLVEPEDFWKKYKEIFQIKLLKNYKPNKVHYFLRKLELMEKRMTIVTQNVDGLHTLAGSKQVIEYHGNLNTATCQNCGTTYDFSYVMAEIVPYCNQPGCGEILKPDIVLFGDPILHHTEAEDAIDNSDFLLVMGTSLQVTPFSLLTNYAASNSEMPLAIINRDSTPVDSLFDFVIHQDLVDTINQLENYLN